MKVSTPMINLGQNTDSLRTEELALKWLDECTQLHQKTCGLQGYADPPLPSRVLDIGGTMSDTVVLCETIGKRAQYICLSYCWGGSEFIRSTTATIKAHMQGIAIKDLPRTFQDLVKMARIFKIQYVWIDSLCIIQDNREDWEKEAGRMAEIYRNSFLTIAATGAQNPHEGLFSTRKQDMIKTVRIQRTRHRENMSRSASADFPLMKRAWAFQERYLPSRLLQFGPDEVSWECLEGSTCECGSSTRERMYFKKRDFFANCISAEMGLYEEPKVESLWRTIVILYSNLELTKSSDKLPALAGLAEYMRSPRNDEYLAGLWKRSLVSDLLWYRETLGYRNGSGSIEQVWNAPTWSWASIDGPVMYPVRLLFGGAPSTQRSTKPFCEIIDAKCTTSGPSRTGQIVSGHIRLSLLIIKGKRNGQGVLRGIDFDVFYPDAEDDTVGEEIYICRMAQVDHHEYSLILRVNSVQDQTFSRVGLLLNTYGRITWPQETSTITIV
jgi:hypothetical protein